MNLFSVRRELPSSRGHLAGGCRPAVHPPFGRRDLLRVGGMGMVIYQSAHGEYLPGIGNGYWSSAWRPPRRDYYRHND